MPTSTGSGTSRRDCAGGGATGAITGGGCGEPFGRLSGLAVASGGLVASTSTGVGGIDRRRVCGGCAAPGEGAEGDNGGVVGGAETCCVGRTRAWTGRTVGRRCGRGFVRISGRLTAAIVRAGGSETVDTLSTTVGVAGMVRGSAGRGAAVSGAAVSGAAVSGAAVSGVAGSVSDAAGSDSTRTGASGRATDPGDVGPSFSGVGAGDAATGPGSAAAGAATGAGTAVGAALSGRNRRGSTYPLGSLVMRTPRWT
jgi:hypothetical protein